MFPITRIRISPIQAPAAHIHNEALLTRVKHLELTLEYIASVAGVYSTDVAMGRRFASIRDAAQQMLDDEPIEADELAVKEFPSFIELIDNEL